MSRDTLRFKLNQRSLECNGEHSKKNKGLSDLTIKSYKASNAKFADFCKNEFGIKNYAQLEQKGVIDIINLYVKSLSERGISAHSIHTYIAPVCKGCNINMGDIEHPKRVSAEITRGRYTIPRSERESNLDRYRKGVELQKAIGIRKSELSRLTGKNIYRIDKHLYVEVENGKGGKYQLQRILPQYENIVIEAFSQVAPNEKVLQAHEISKNINYHGYRADLAKEAYQYYLNRIKTNPNYYRELQKELVIKYKRYHPKASERQQIEFAKRLKNSEYKLRGNNLKLAIEKGLPITYNRLALMAVSIEHLSHWRLDVTVNNYMLA